MIVFSSPRETRYWSAAAVRLWAKLSSTRCHDRFSATCDLRLPIFDCLSSIAFLGGGDDRCLATRPQIETQHKGIEEVFRKLESSFALGVIFKVAVPVTRFA